MPETETFTLPVLPLANGAVLPQRVVPIAHETDEARAAAQAARDGDGRLVLVPKADGRYSRVGTVARVENAGELGNGLQALVVRGLARARVGSGSPGPSGALHVTLEPIDEGTATAHFHGTGHPLIQSYEPGEEWFYCYADDVMFELEGRPPSPSHP